jgi:hypothetical protein
MKKIIDKDAAVDSDAVVNPELLFCDDALVVDYLNALLASEPALNMDFREIHFVHQEIQPNIRANTIVGNAMSIESEFSITEVDILRSENENLKFKTELASIDAQVLRNENDKLKIEKNRLVAQLSEMKVKLTTVQAENDSLRQSAETASYRLDPPATHVEDQMQDAHTDFITHTEIATEGDVSDPEHIFLEEIAEQDSPPEAVVMVEECRNDCKIKTSIPIDQERSIISGTPIPNDFVKKMNTHGVAIFSRERTAGGVSLQNDQPLSKVIKHHPAERNRTQQTGHIQKTASPNAIPREKNKNAADFSPNFVPQQHHIAEIESNQETDTTSPYAAVQQLKNADEITMPDAPEPKVVIRRNVKNYEDLQKESDSIKTTETGHTIVL